MNDRVEIYRRRTVRRSQQWRWRLIVNSRKVAHGGEGYANFGECEAMSHNIVAGHYKRALNK